MAEEMVHNPFSIILIRHSYKFYNQELAPMLIAYTVYDKYQHTQTSNRRNKQISLYHLN